MELMHFIAGLMVEKAYAIATLPIQCQGLVGCGGQASNLFLNGIPRVALFILQVAAGISVLSIIWAGFQMVLSWGDTGKIGQAKNAILFSLLGLGLSVMSQFIISSVVSELPSIPDNSNTIHLDIMYAIGRYLRNILNAAMALAIVAGAVRMVLAQGKQDEFAKGRTAVVWAIIGALVVNFAAAIASIASGLLGV